MTPTLYTTVSDVETYLSQELDEAGSANVTALIASVTQQIDTLANREPVVAGVYGDDDEYALRYFDVIKRGQVSIDDCVNIESVECQSGTTWVELDEYAPYPALPPHWRIINAAALVPGEQNVRISAKWGYVSTLPADLKHAATIMVAASYLAGKSNTGNAGGRIQREKVGTYDVTYAVGNSDGMSSEMRDLDEAHRIIMTYRKPLI
jgi:hypothetical protein